MRRFIILSIVITFFGLLSFLAVLNDVSLAQSLPAPITVGLGSTPSITTPNIPVKLVAFVSGANPGSSIRYQFYCKSSDSQPVSDVTSTNNPYSLDWKCSYSSTGTFTPKVHIQVAGKTSDATASIRVVNAVIAAVSNYASRDYSSPCTSFGSIFIGKCIDVKINGSDGPVVLNAPASYEIAVNVQSGLFRGSIGDCYLFDPADGNNIMQVYNTSNLREIFLGSLWYIKGGSSVPAGTYKYFAVCFKKGSVTEIDEADVTVTGGTTTPPPSQPPATPPPATVNVALLANPSVITQGQSASLSWGTSGVTSCSGSASPSDSNWSGSITPVGGGRRTVTPGQTTAYSLSCSGPGGSSIKNVQITVLPPSSSPPPSGPGCFPQIDIKVQ